MIHLTHANFFPYETYRKEQQDIIRLIELDVRLKKNILLVAPNGAGKTVIALSALLPVAIEQDLKIIYLCRTHTQTSVKKFNLVRKVIFDLINLDEKEFAISICKTILKVKPHDRIASKVIDEFIKYKNYSGALDMCALFLQLKLDKWSIISKVVLESLKKSQEDHKICNIIRLILEFKPPKEFICEVIYQAINVKKYRLVFEILPVLIKFSIADISFYLRIIYLVNDNGQCQEAFESCKALLESYPKSSNAWIALGYTLISLGEHQKALDVYNHTIKITSSTDFTGKSKIWSYIGLTLIYMGDFKKAIDICRKNLKIHRKYARSYYQLGLIHYKKGNLESGIKYMKKALALDQNQYRTWATLGQIYLELNNCHEAFSACYACLSINNQCVEGISLYEQLMINPLVKVLSWAIPKIIKYGYREALFKLNDPIFSPEFLRQHRYICYSEAFQDFLREVRETPSENIIAIYGQFHKCGNCNSPLRVYGEKINFKSGYKTLLYRCVRCGFEEEEISQTMDELSYIRINAIVKTLLHTRQTTLNHEKTFLTYYTIDELQNIIKTGRQSTNFSNLNNSVLLYGVFSKSIIRKNR